MLRSKKTLILEYRSVDVDKPLEPIDVRIEEIEVK